MTPWPDSSRLPRRPLTINGEEDQWIPRASAVEPFTTPEPDWVKHVGYAPFYLNRRLRYAQAVAYLGPPPDGYVLSNIDPSAPDCPENWRWGLECNSWFLNVAIARRHGLL